MNDFLHIVSHISRAAVTTEPCRRVTTINAERLADSGAATSPRMGLARGAGRECFINKLYGVVVPAALERVITAGTERTRRLASYYLL